MAYQFLPIYNIHTPVGANQANNPRDVELVQRLFNLWRRYAPSAAALPALANDGAFSPSLGQHIAAFQAQSTGPTPPQRSHRPDQASPSPAGGMAHDGRIDPIRQRDMHFLQNIGRHTSTLLLLNFNCCQRNATAHRRIAEEMQLLIEFSMR